MFSKAPFLSHMQDNFHHTTLLGTERANFVSNQSQAQYSPRIYVQIQLLTIPVLSQ
jgi:hypothetical protein